MNVYKIDPEAIEKIKQKCPQIEIIYLVNGEESHRTNETKATGMKVTYQGQEYIVEYYRDVDGLRVYEVTEVGVVLNKVIGKYDTVHSALMRIIDSQPLT